MGNLCGTQAGGQQEGQDSRNHANSASGPQTNGVHSSQQEQHAKSVAAAAPPPQPAKPAKAAPADPIQAALADAKVELEKNHNKIFDDYYVTSKLIGHGAFAKVGRSWCLRPSVGECMSVRPLTE